MNVQPMSVTREQAAAALREYKEHRSKYDQRDWEIERIYRAISKGRVVLSVNEAIRSGGVDELGRPRLAIMRADQAVCICRIHGANSVIFTNEHGRRGADWHFEIPWPNRPPLPARGPWTLQARLPRIPPQHRPDRGRVASYHLLWEADWSEIPRDPMLLRRIGKDAWIVLAAWDLTDVEMCVLRAHSGGQR